MNADHADLNPRVSAQIRVPFSFRAFFKHPDVRDEFSDWPGQNLKLETQIQKNLDSEDRSEDRG
jgi:hypothetical protein